MAENASVKWRLSITALVFAVLWTALYILVYQLEPFSEIANLVLLNFIEVVAAMLAAIILGIVASYYQPGEPPRRVWLMFAIAISSWAIADIVWSAYNILVGEVPSVSLADVFWGIGYVFFTVSLTQQFQLITFNHDQRYYWAGAGIWIGIILIVLGITTLSAEGTVADFFAFFYPVADFVVGIAAIFLAVSFRSGTLARPWLGLFVFVVADSLYLWATVSGSFDWVSRSGLLTLLAELVYVVAYLFLAWGAFSQYLALRYGVTVYESDTKPNKVPRLSTKITP